MPLTLGCRGRLRVRSAAVCERRGRSISPSSRRGPAACGRVHPCAKALYPTLFYLHPPLPLCSSRPGEHNHRLTIRADRLRHLCFPSYNTYPSALSSAVPSSHLALPTSFHQNTDPQTLSRPPPPSFSSTSCPVLRSRPMASSNQYLSPQQQQYFQSNRLPSPSELGLSYPNRGATLSPGSTTLRYPPSSSYNHPSLANVSSQLQSPPTASSTQAWTPRASGSSDTASPSLRQSDLRPKAESEDAAGSSSQAGDGQARVKHENEDGMPATSDFVKKLYKCVVVSIFSLSVVNSQGSWPCRMLEDNTFADVVCWGPQGDCFVIKDLNEFTKSILPRMFKHSNFASFVRQLNKYDFHKVSRLCCYDRFSVRTSPRVCELELCVSVLSCALE